MVLQVNRTPVLTLWAVVVAERLGQPHETALTLGRAVAGSAARVKARSLGREETNRDQEISELQATHVTAPAVLLGKEIRLLPNEDGELRAADGEQPAAPDSVRRYLAKAFGDQLVPVRLSTPAEFSPEVPIEISPGDRTVISRRWDRGPPPLVAGHGA